MTVLVTGGGGFLGHYIVDQLVARGDRVRVLCRGDYPTLRKQGVELIQGDLRNPDAASQACRNVETVIHTAAIAGIWGKWKDYYEINTLGTRHLLDAALNYGVRRFIHTSSPSVVFDGQSHLNADETLPYPQSFLCHYPHSKKLAEELVLQAHGQRGLLTTALRPHLIWGPRDHHLIPRLITRARSGRLRRVGDGNNLVSNSYVENAAAAHLQAAAALQSEQSACGGQAYFINELEPVRLWDWINQLLDHAGVPQVKQAISARAAYAIGATLEGVYKLFGRTSEPPMTRFLALQLSQSHTYSVRRAQQDLGYTPVVSPEVARQRHLPELQQLGSLSLKS